MAGGGANADLWDAGGATPGKQSKACWPDPRIARSTAGSGGVTDLRTAFALSAAETEVTLSPPGTNWRARLPRSGRRHVTLTPAMRPGREPACQWQTLVMRNCGPQTAGTQRLPAQGSYAAAIKRPSGRATGIGGASHGGASHDCGTIRGCAGGGGAFSWVNRVLEARSAAINVALPGVHGPSISAR